MTGKRGKRAQAPAGAAGEAGQQTVMTFRPAAALRDAVHALAKAERRSASVTLEILVEEALAARGRWPPAGGEGRS